MKLQIEHFTNFPLISMVFGQLLNIKTLQVIISTPIFQQTARIFSGLEIHNIPLGCLNPTLQLNSHINYNQSRPLGAFIESNHLSTSNDLIYWTQHILFPRSCRNQLYIQGSITLHCTLLKRNTEKPQMESMVAQATGRNQSAT